MAALRTQGNGGSSHRSSLTSLQPHLLDVPASPLQRGWDGNQEAQGPTLNLSSTTCRSEPLGAGLQPQRLAFSICETAVLIAQALWYLLSKQMAALTCGYTPPIILQSDVLLN